MDGISIVSVVVIVGVILIAQDNKRVGVFALCEYRALLSMTCIKHAHVSVGYAEHHSLINKRSPIRKSRAFCCLEFETMTNKRE